MKKYENIFFDLDGTLTDSAPGILNSFSHALTAMGLPVPDREELLKVIGPPLAYSFERFFHLEEEDVQRAIDHYRSYYADKGVFENKLYEGIPQLLSSLAQAGRRLCLASTKAEYYVKLIAEHFGIDKYFTFICGSDAAAGRDTKAQVIGRILEGLSIASKDTCLMVGDRAFDVEGAQERGIDCLGVLYGYGDLEELTKAGATYTASSVQELGEMLL